MKNHEAMWRPAMGRLHGHLFFMALVVSRKR